MGPLKKSLKALEVLRPVKSEAPSLLLVCILKGAVSDV